MPSIFSIGRTLSRTMPSILSSSLPRRREWRAASLSMFSASLSCIAPLRLDLEARGGAVGPDLLGLRLGLRGDPARLGEA